MALAREWWVSFDHLAIAPGFGRGSFASLRDHYRYGRGGGRKHARISWDRLLRARTWCMARTNMDLDDNACRTVMKLYHLSTKREAVSFAVRTVAAEPLDLDHQRALRGSG